MSGRWRKVGWEGQAGWLFALAIATSPAAVRAQVMLDWNGDALGASLADEFDTFLGGLVPADLYLTRGFSLPASARFTYRENADTAAIRLRAGLAASTTVYFRRQVRWGVSNWGGTWPDELTSALYSTTTDRNDWVGEDVNGFAYVREQLVYAPGASFCSQTNVPSLRVALPPNRQEVEPYPAAVSMTVDLWHKVETWLRLNPVKDVADGEYALWVDDVLVFYRNDVAFLSTAKPAADGFRELVVGGSLASSSCQVGAAIDRYFYVDDFYVSTTLDRDGGLPVPDGGLDGGPADSGVAEAGQDAGVYAVVDFTLINADDGQPIDGFDPLYDGAVLDLSALPTRNLSIRANTNPSVVGSVAFGLDSNPSHQIENTVPYALFSNSGADYNPWTPPVGEHTVVATPYTGATATGSAGTPLSVHFTVVDCGSGGCDGGTTDAGIDAGGDDGGAVDGGAPDAEIVDAGDSGEPDAGADGGLDSGTDADGLPIDPGGGEIVGHYCSCGLADPAPLVGLAGLLLLRGRRRRATSRRARRPAP